MDRIQQLELFFEQYAARVNQALQDPPVVDVDGAVASFANYFIEASPNSVMCGKNDEQFRAVIPQGFAFYKSIGTTAMNVAGVDVTPLDELHAMARVHWDSRYRRQDGDEVRIEFDVIYFLQVRDGQPKIFAYVTGEEQQVLRDHGLLPG